MQRKILYLLVLVFSLALAACGGTAAVTAEPTLVEVTPLPTATDIPPTDEPEPTATGLPPTEIPMDTPTPDPTVTPDPQAEDLWRNMTETTIGLTSEWTNKVELADINGDGLVDILFANGGFYDAPDKPTRSQAFLNQAPAMQFLEVTDEVFGSTGMLARVIKARDVNNDGNTDIMVGTTFQTQSRLFLGDGEGVFSEVTETHLPQIDASIGDLDFGDVDGDGDLDMVLADWGPGSPMTNSGGRTMLWLNDGAGVFSDVTAQNTPDALVRFSWELEVVDVDNDYDLDILVSCKQCTGSFMFENDGFGRFTDVSSDRLPQHRNNYDFEAMDLNSDTYLDLITINDGLGLRDQMFINDGQGAYVLAAAELWPTLQNPGSDDNMVAFLDYESDGDADFLIGSLNGAERILINDGTGHVMLLEARRLCPGLTRGTLGIAVADLNGDHRLDYVEAQGETDWPEKVCMGQNNPPDTAPPIITLVSVTDATPEEGIIVRARIHDNKSPTMPHDWQSVFVRWTAADGRTGEVPLQWYGEYLWRAALAEAGGDATIEVCAVDAAGNEACAAAP